MNREMVVSSVPWLGEIPSTWEVERSKYNFKYHKDVAKEKASNYERLALTMKGVIKRSKDDMEGLQPKDFEGYQIVNTGDLVFKLIDLAGVSTSRVGLSDYEGLVSPAYILLHADDTKLDKHYAKYFFLSMWHRLIFNEIGNGGIRSSLNSGDLLEVPITKPPLDEQHAIVRYLDKKCAAIDEAIERHKMIIEKLEELQDAYITDIVMHGIHSDDMKDSGYSVIGLIPSEWDVCRLRFIGTPINGISKGSECFGHGYPFVSYGDVYRNFALPEQVAGLVDSTPEERERYSVKKGDIFFTRTSETIDEVGFSSVCEHTIVDATFAGFLIRVRPRNNRLLTRYAKYYFRGKHLREYFAREMNITTRASLGQNFLKNVPVLLPTHEEQREIACHLDKFCLANKKSRATHQEIITKLEEYKKSIIYNAVTGKIDCRESAL